MKILAAGGACLAAPLRLMPAPLFAASDKSLVAHVNQIPTPDFASNNYHPGLDNLVYRLAESGSKLYRSSFDDALSANKGLIHKDDVVVIKVNATFTERGNTNSDVVRGLIQRILDHPDGFGGEIVLIENGQGFGSFDCDRGRSSPNANAENPAHSFKYLVNEVFAGKPVSTYLLDDIRTREIGISDHSNHGYRKLNSLVNYPCFTTRFGTRIELREGVYSDGRYHQNLKYINVPVLKDHDGCGITGALKLGYGTLSMSLLDWYSFAVLLHYQKIGEVTGGMFSLVRPPIINILDCIWVCHKGWDGHPPENTTRTNTLLASIDPVALDYIGAKHVLYPINNDPDHNPDINTSDSNLKDWLTSAAATINANGGIFGASVTCDAAMIEHRAYQSSALVEVSLNKRIYGAGDTMRVYLRLHNPSPAFEADLYLAVGYMGTWYYYPSFAATPQPVRFTMPANCDLGPVMLLELPLNQPLPAQELTWVAGLVDRGTMNLRAPVSSVACRGTGTSTASAADLKALLNQGKEKKTLKLV